MASASRIALVLASFTLLGAPAALAATKTVCTITVNSADEKEAFRRRLPAGEYRFVELLRSGRHDWLRAACEERVQCDVLMVSGHFNAGDTFYSDKVAATDHLDVDELERASCSESCPGVFAHLKEVYLFGCESLNPDSTRYASSYGESGRDRMRRLFAGVPSIYGFYSSAPVGPTAAMLIDRYFDATPGAAIGTGRPNRGLLAAFRNNHITLIHGLGKTEGEAARREICPYYDERSGAEGQLAFIHAELDRDDARVRSSFDRIEKLFASFGDLDRQSPSFRAALAGIAADRSAGERFLALARAAARPELRVRMLAFARGVGWLDADGERAERVRLVEDLLARSASGYAEVELVCSMNDDRALDGALPAASGRATLAQSGMRACVGDRDARLRVLAALAQGDAGEARIAQAYLRHRPLDASELRDVAGRVARIDDPRAQALALETLALQNISDRAILEGLTRAFATARSAGVQRAIAEVFIRSDPDAIPRRELATVLREHRLGPTGAGDLVDVLTRRLAGTG